MNIFSDEFEALLNRVKTSLLPLPSFYALFATLMKAVPEAFNLEEALEKCDKDDWLLPVRTDQMLADFIAITNDGHCDEPPTALLRAGCLDLTKKADLRAAMPYLDRILPYYAEIKDLNYIIRDRREQVGTLLDDVDALDEEPNIEADEFLCLSEWNGEGYVVLSCEQGGEAKS